MFMIIPAIDLLDGKCVRLSQGDLKQATVYSSSPAEVAKKWEKMGAGRLHVVDLNGAVEGRPVNRDAIRQICSSVSMEVELGGGIRDLETIEAYMDDGVDYVILGTAAVKDPVLLKQSCARFAGRIIIGIDARDGMVSVQGWTEETRTDVIDFACRLDSKAVKAIIFTDISRDGMLTGPNLESTVRLANAVKIPVIASGGVSGIQDVKNLLNCGAPGIEGVIIGRALYTGAIDLEECIRLVEVKNRADGGAAGC